MADLVFSSFKKFIGDGTFDMDADTFQCALLTSAYAPSAGHSVWADVAASEATGAGYAAGGKTLANVTWATSGTGARLDADDPQWTATSVTARYAVIYAAKTVGSLVDPLVCLLDFGADKGVTGGTFTVQFDAAGILTLN